MHTIAQRCIAKEREAARVAGSEYHSLLSVLVHARDDDGAKLDEDELVHNVYSFFGAGVASTAHAMRSQLFMLARHPKVQEKLYQEVKAGPLEWDFVKNLPYLSAVISESLRLYPSIQGSATRDLTTDVLLPGGLHAAKGTSVGVNSLASQRRPAVWGPDADDFRPERFLNGQPEDKGVGNPLLPHRTPPGLPDTAFLAFGYGARPCIGRPLAMIEMKMVLAHAVRQYEIVEMDPKGFEIVMAPPFIFPKRSLKLGLRPRP
jgi:cytochrome P450